MAVFPDRIVQKNSTDDAAIVRTAIDPVIGSDPIIGGELVVQRSVGGAQLLTLDANNSPVVVGVSSNVGAVSPSIKLNFEDDGTDTPYEYVVGGVPFDTSGKFGDCFKHTASSVAPRINPLRVLAGDMPILGSASWTFSFWFKSDFAFDFYTASPSPNSLLVISAKDYVHGPGAFTITIDGGTTDTGGTGTATSRTQDLAKGAIVFGLGGMYGATENTIPQIPSTGEIVTSAATAVCDNDWHFVTFMHEGSGVYSCFVDGLLKERNVLDSPVNHSFAGTSGILMPSGLEFGGALQINENDVFPGTEMHGFNGRLDGVTLYAGNAIYRGLRQFDVPTAAPTDAAVQQPLDTLRTLIDTSIDLTPGNGETLVYNSTEGAWENAPAPAFSLAGNNLGDIGDVNIVGVASLTQGETITWDVATSGWVNSPLLIENTDVDTTLTGTGFVIRHDGLTGWKSERLDYGDLNNAPTGLSDLTQDLDLSLYDLVDLGDVATSNLAEGDVLSWNASTQQFENVAQPPANITGSLLGELANVDTSGQSAGDWLAFNSGTSEWEARYLDYSEIANRPTHLSEFTNNLDLSHFSNNAGYITISGLSSQSVDVFGDVAITSPLESQVLVYRSGEWRNEFGPPANITSNSIGDLADVTRTQAAITLPAVVTMEDMGHLVFDSPLLASNITYQVMYDHGRLGLGLSAIRDSDNTGSEIFVSRGGGVDLRSDVNFFRLRGKPDVITNRPELRFETGDSFATPSTGHYISLKMPDTVLEDQTYYLPQEDGDVGDVLATNGTGELAWVARVANNDLGQLNDVDLTTQLPVQGSALVYNAAASMWVPGASVVDLSTSTLDDISDVAYGGLPGTGQALLWSGTAWVPGDISVANALDDLTDVSYTNGSLEITGLDEIFFSSADVPSGEFYKVYANGTYGAALGAYDSSTVKGSFVYVHKSKGIELRSDVSGIIRISGESTETDNQPELRWESGNATFTTPNGAYIGLKLPANHTVDQTYVLPALDGSAGQALSTDGSGALSWVTPGADLSISSIDELQDVDTTSAVPAIGQALVWDGFTSWVPGDVAVDEASPAIVWNVTNVGVISYGFTGSGFSALTSNPTLYVVRGQKYTFNKTVSAHPLELRDASNAQYTAGVAESQPVALGELNWTVPMDAPSTLSYQCTAHSQMNGTIHVLEAGVDLAASNIEELANVSSSAPTAGQALVWDGTEWVPGNVLSSGGATGSAISQSVIESQTSNTAGELTFVDLGTSGTIVSVQVDAAAWVTIYSAAALRTTDASRVLADDPAQGSGVLAEFVLPISTEILATPSTNYFNSNALPAEEIYVLVRDASTGLVMDGVSVTLRAYAISGYTAVSGGTFGSG